MTWSVHSERVLAVTAEGVETAVQRDLLKVLGCDEMQGYFFSRPVPGEETSDLLPAGIGEWAA
ncbi:MAG: EAL domain-containing protein [Desulfobulbus sp.]|nr:EAL domain-containing protein [Desulfobulbus sp.]